MGPSSDYDTKELSTATWPDLERLFRRPGIGDAWWCWCTYHHGPANENSRLRTRKEKAVKNRSQKKKMVEQDRSHGIIVYAKGEPVGWCQYGLSNELPRVSHNRDYRARIGDRETERLWRISCFVVDKDHRRKGVATAALNGALQAISRKGGGSVEAFPVSQTDQGPGYMYTGRVSMFEKKGFKVAAPLSTGRTSTVVMRKRL